MKKLKSAILSQNHRRSQGGGPGVKKSYFNPLFTNIFNKHLTNIFPKQTFFFKNFPNQFFHFPKQFFSNINIFFQILQKFPSGWGLCPQTPVCDTFEYTSFLNTSPKLDIFAFITASFRPLPLPKSWLSDNRPRLHIFHSAISLPYKKFCF